MKVLAGQAEHISPSAFCCLCFSGLILLFLLLMSCSYRELVGHVVPFIAVFYAESPGSSFLLFENFCHISVQVLAPSLERLS